jgi:dihydrolipoamide dehydrogenase
VPNDAQSFDIVILGAGTGGYSAAFRAGQLGLRVALVDDRAECIGGTCLHVGCIPTKAMQMTADPTTASERPVTWDSLRLDRRVGYRRWT